MKHRILLTLLLVTRLTAPSAAAEDIEAPRTWPWRQWIEPNFPFFSTAVDARSMGAADLKDNLTPRALVFPLGQDGWLAFDVDLLRVAAVWVHRRVPVRERWLGRQQLSVSGH